MTIQTKLHTLFRTTGRSKTISCPAHRPFPPPFPPETPLRGVELQWSQSIFIFLCLILSLVKMCSFPSIPSSIYVVQPINYKRIFKTGEMIILGCKKGLTKQSHGDPIRVCVNGKWTQSSFKCGGKVKPKIRLLLLD